MCKDWETTVLEEVCVGQFSWFLFVVVPVSFDNNEKYVSFLADIVSGDYSDKDESVNQIINSNI